MKLYKYLTPERIDILYNCQVRFSQASALNDPFELRASIPNPYINQLQGAYFLDRNNGLTEAKTFQDWLKTERGQMIMQKYDGYAPTIEMETEMAAEHFGKHFCILSLTELFDNILMWSHYSDFHKGFVIEFNGDHPFFNRGMHKYLGTVNRVAYSTKRPKTLQGLRVDWMLEGVSSQELVLETYLECIFTKGTDWMHEKEWRFILPTSEGRRTDIEANKYPVIMYDFPREIITAVICGVVSSYELEQKLFEWCTQFKIPYYKATIAESDYRLVIYNYDTYLKNQPTRYTQDLFAFLMRKDRDRS